MLATIRCSALEGVTCSWEGPVPTAVGTLYVDGVAVAPYPCPPLHLAEVEEAGVAVVADDDVVDDLDADEVAGGAEARGEGHVLG